MPVNDSPRSLKGTSTPRTGLRSGHKIEQLTLIGTRTRKRKHIMGDDEDEEAKRLKTQKESDEMMVLLQEIRTGQQNTSKEVSEIKIGQAEVNQKLTLNIEKVDGELKQLKTDTVNSIGKLNDDMHGIRVRIRTLEEVKPQKTHREPITPENALYPERKSKEDLLQQLEEDSRRIIIYRVPFDQEPTPWTAIPRNSKISARARQELEEVKPTLINTNNTEPKTCNWKMDFSSVRIVREILKWKEPSPNGNWDFSVHRKYRQQWRMFKTLKWYLINTQSIIVWIEQDGITLKLGTKNGYDEQRRLLAEYTPGTEKEKLPTGLATDETEPQEVTQRQNKGDNKKPPGNLKTWNLAQEFKSVGITLQSETNKRKMELTTRSLIITGNDMDKIKDKDDFRQNINGISKHIHLIANIEKRNAYTYSILLNTQSDAYMFANENAESWASNRQWKTSLLICNEQME